MFSCVFAGWTRYCCGCIAVYFKGKLYFTRDVPEANCMPQGLEPPVKPAAKPAPKAAKPLAKPSKRAAKPAAQVAAKPAAKPAAGEPFPWPLLSMCSSLAAGYLAARAHSRLCLLGAVASGPTANQPIPLQQSTPAAHVTFIPRCASSASSKHLPRSPYSHARLAQLSSLSPTVLASEKVAHRACGSVDLPAGSFLVILWFTFPRVCSLLLCRASSV